jgi:hypothetical protein
MLSRVARLIGSTLLVTISSIANADTLWNQQVAGWHAGAYTRSGSFSHCAASVPYKSGILLVFSINKNFQWSMGLINPAWNLTTGNTYNIQYNVDLDEAEPAVASAFTSHGVEIGLKDAVPLFNRFKAGKTLYVHAQSSHFQFNLTNSSKVLDFLLACAGAKGNRPQIASSNPFAAPKSQAAKPDAPKDRTAEQGEAMVVAANLVSAMGITNFTFLKPTEIPSSMAVDAAWKSSAGLGGVAVLPKNNDAASISTNVLSYDAKSCRKTFASGTLPADGKGNFQQLFTKCGSGKDGIISYYLIVPRQAGGNYVISTYTKEGFDDVAKPNADIRAAAFKVLPK